MHVSHIPVLLLIGSAILAGTVGGRLFQFLRVPQVVGYIIIGVVVGKSGFQLVNDDTLKALLPLNLLALGIIGFLIGGELRLSVFRKYGRKLMVILLAEGIVTAVMVGALVTSITFVATAKAADSIAFGLLLGAIASATAPAATSPT